MFLEYGLHDQVGRCQIIVDHKSIFQIFGKAKLVYLGERILKINISHRQIWRIPGATGTENQGSPLGGQKF